MIKVVISGESSQFSSPFLSGLKQGDVIIEETFSGGQETLNFIRENKADLVIAGEKLMDMTGIEMIQELVKVNPFVNTAVVSGLGEKDFHEATEGLGILMAIPPDADEAFAVQLLDYYKKVIG